MIWVSQSVIADRLRALTRALDGGATPGKLLIYSAPNPGVGQPAGAQPLVTVAFPAFSEAALAGKKQTLQLPGSALVQITGEAAWARLADGGGNFVADLDVGLPGSTAALWIDNRRAPADLMLFAGGDFDLSLAEQVEP